MKPGQRPNLVTVLIDDLMPQPVAQRVSDACLELEAQDKLHGFDLDDLSSLHSVPRWFGSTSGPFKGVGGSAMTWFQLTVVYSDKVMVMFANDRLYGVAPFEADALLRVDPDDFTYTPLAAPGREKSGY
jgi:hypothetical protein